VTEPQDTIGRVGRVGKTLGRYRIAAELGRGGMATVYRAFDPQLSRDVAVKVIHGAFTGRGDIEKRFRREAQAVAGLKHEGIVAVFDFAPGGDGEPAYIVSELVEGPTLRRLLDDCGGHGLLPEVATVIGARVAAALGAAHARGIVHRDVKPDNVMIDRGGRTGGEQGGARVLLTDFGIARMVEDDTLTATGSILGSPAYMSPEQAKGATIGPPSDVFSLGVMLYQLATGRPPFGGKDPLTVLAAVVSGDFLRPSQIDARISPELEAVVLRCLRRAPAERYPDGAALHAALHEVAARNAPGAALADEGVLLRRFLDDREALGPEIARAAAEDALARARAAVRRGELSRALAQINRALAYVPGHRGAEALLATISSRRRWLRAAAVLGALAVAGSAAALARRHHAATPPPAPIAESHAAPGPAPVSVPAAVSVPVPVAVPVPVPPTAPAPPQPLRASPARKRAATPRHDGPARSAAAAPSATTVGAPVELPAAAAPPPPPPAATPPAAAPGAGPAPAATAGLTLRASYGFCSPSLDDRPAALRPVYATVPPGTHRIFCTLPGGARVLVATYDLRAGTHPNLVIVPGPDGKPTLARPE
jgi:serine/threonine-protein kinase